MDKREQLAEGFYRYKTVENLLLMAVLGSGTVGEQARRELQRRRVVSGKDDFEDSFMTNLSVV